VTSPTASVAGQRLKDGPEISGFDNEPAPDRIVRRRPSTWRVPAALIAFSLIPVLAGSARLIGLSGGPELIPADSRFAASPVPVVVHVLSAIVYSVLGAFQFSTGLRSRRPGWHRAAGRLLVVLGLAVAFSALWLTQFYPPAEGRSGELLYVFRLLAGSAMALSIVLGFAAIRRRDVSRHRAWMTRAYALALGAATQAFTLGIGEPVFGSGELSTALLMGAGWGINVAVAERVIRKRTTRPVRNRGR
jgi:uncharacterized membrane protein